jgi:hypothetical protein
MHRDIRTRRSIRSLAAASDGTPDRPRRCTRIACMLLAAIMLGSILTVATPSAAHARDDDAEEPGDGGGGGGGGGGGTTGPQWPTPKDKFDWMARQRAQKWAEAWNVYEEEDKTAAWSKNIGEYYDPSYVNPASYTLDFKGCYNAADYDKSAAQQQTAYKYRWKVGTTTMLNGRDCIVSLPFSTQGLFQVTVDTINLSTGAVVKSHTEAVRVKDYLMVVLGDSFASGEGVPDVGDAKHRESGEATWVDKRCHRSAKAGPYLAAETLEKADPKTSVTFISFACSGATLERSYEGEGSGILGEYWGIEWADSYDAADDEVYAGHWDATEYNNMQSPLPSQIDQLERAIKTLDPAEDDKYPQRRTIDSMVVSAGLNDIFFSNIMATCLLKEDCWSAHVEDESSGQSFQLETRTKNYLDELDEGFIKLRNEIDERGLRVNNAYTMEYPTPFVGPNGNCNSVLADAITGIGEFLSLVLGDFLFGWIFDAVNIDAWEGVLVGSEVDAAEVDWLQDDLFPIADPIFKSAAAAGGFTQIGGISDRFEGHGYCAGSEALIRTADSAAAWQGPWNDLVEGVLGVNARSDGTLHPNYGGHVVVGEQIRSGLQPIFNVNAPVARHDMYTMYEDTTITTSGADKAPHKKLTSNDSDPNGFQLVVTQATASVGTLKLVPNSGGSFTYTPPPNFYGIVNVSYTLSNGFLSVPGTATITVHPLPDELRAVDDSFWVYPGETVTLDLEANDLNGDGVPTTISIGAVRPAVGRFIFDGGLLRYEAPAQLDGTVTFSFPYTLQGPDSSSQATVTIKVGWPVIT